VNIYCLDDFSGFAPANKPSLNNTSVSECGKCTIIKHGGRKPQTMMA